MNNWERWGKRTVRCFVMLLGVAEVVWGARLWEWIASVPLIIGGTSVISASADIWRKDHTDA